MWDIIKILRLFYAIEDFKKMTKCGFIAFSNVTENGADGKVIYDEHKVIWSPTLQRWDYPIVLDHLIDECHHDIISTYDDLFKLCGCKFLAVHEIYRDANDNNQSKWFGEIRFSGYNTSVIIENGQSYLA